MAMDEAGRKAKCRMSGGRRAAVAGQEGIGVAINSEESKKDTQEGGESRDSMAREEMGDGIEQGVWSREAACYLEPAQPADNSIRAKDGQRSFSADEESRTTAAPKGCGIHQ